MANQEKSSGDTRQAFWTGVSVGAIPAAALAGLLSDQIAEIKNAAANHQAFLDGKAFGYDEAKFHYGVGEYGLRVDDTGGASSTVQKDSESVLPAESLPDPVLVSCEAKTVQETELSDGSTTVIYELGIVATGERGADPSYQYQEVEIFDTPEGVEATENGDGTFKIDWADALNPAESGEKDVVYYTAEDVPGGLGVPLNVPEAPLCELELDTSNT